VSNKIIKFELLLDFIRDINPASEKIPLNADTDLIGTGAIDSYSMIQLIDAFEQRLGIIFNFTDLNAENFRSPQTLLEMLVAKYDCQIEGPA